MRPPGASLYSAAFFLEFLQKDVQQRDHRTLRVLKNYEDFKRRNKHLNDSNQQPELRTKKNQKNLQLLRMSHPVDGVKKKKKTQNPPPVVVLFVYWGQPWYAFVNTVFQIYVVLSSLNLTRTLQRQKQYIKKLIFCFYYYSFLSEWN